MTIVRKGFGDVFEFSRAGSATYWGPDGKLHTAGPDEPRFHYDPVTGEALGLLVEGQATNYIVNNTFDNLAGITQGYIGGLSVNEGGLRGLRFIRAVNETAATAARVQFNLSAPVSNLLKLTMAVRAPSAWSSVDVGLRAGAEWLGITNCQIISGPGQVGPASAVPRITGLSNEWTQILVYPETITTSTNISGVYVYFATGGVSVGAVLDICMLQLEIGNAPSSYILTNGSPATRPADILTRALQAPEYNPSEGTMLLRANTKSETIYLDGLSNGIEATDGEGTLVYTYDDTEAVVYGSTFHQYITDAPPQNPELNVAQGNADLKLLAYYPRTFNREESLLNASGDLNINYPEYSWRPFGTEAGEVLVGDDGEPVWFWNAA